MLGRLTFAVSLVAFCAPALAQETAPARDLPKRPVPVKPAPQVDFGVQWRAQDGAYKNDLTGNTANTLRNSTAAPGAAGSGINAGFQFKW